MKKTKLFHVSYFLDKNPMGTECLCAQSEADLLKYLKRWYYREYKKGFSPKFEYKEIVQYKPLTALFVDKDVRDALNGLMKDVKDLYKSYPDDSVKKARLKTFSVEMWNELQDEFYHTANICINSVWKWSDKFKAFDEYGYLQFDFEPCELDEWSKYVSTLYHRDWAIEILRLIQEFNLDNQEPVYAKAFKEDFKSCRTQEQFCSAVYKWTDLIRWSPWKMSLLDNSFQQPRNVHYEDDFNPDVDEEIFED